jgi:KDO2-lipid IV(A) lauroyltransferase
MSNRSAIARKLRHYLLYPVEAVVIHALYHLVALLPVDWASAFGGWLGRSLGPHLPFSRRAQVNLRRALPELSDSRHREILRGMWDNLGRVMAEHPHLDRLWDDPVQRRIEVVGVEHLPHPVEGQPRPHLMFSGHLANWELLPIGASRHGLTLTSIYRKPNNPLIQELMTAGRRAGRGRLVPKGRDGARAIVAALAEGGTVAMLVDQKMNDGISIPFFGRMAMTAPAVAQLALKFRCPLLPTRTERLAGTRFRLTILPPLTVPDTGNREADIRTLMTTINALLESWIRERPDQWLWLHKRWPD